MKEPTKEKKAKYGVWCYTLPFTGASYRVDFVNKKEARIYRDKVNKKNPLHQAYIVKITKMTAWWRWKVKHWYPLVLKNTEIFL